MPLCEVHLGRNSIMKEFPSKCYHLWRSRVFPNPGKDPPLLESYSVLYKQYRPSNFKYIDFTVNLPLASNLHLQESSNWLPLKPSKSPISPWTKSISHTKSRRHQFNAQLASVTENSTKSLTFASFWVDKENSLGYLSRKAISPLQGISQKLVVKISFEDTGQSSQTWFSTYLKYMD